MVVDDDTDDLFIIRRLLAKAGVPNKVITFEDSTAAIEYLQGQTERPNGPMLPCVLVTDLLMPGTSGLDLTRWVKSHPLLKRLRVVMITESDNAADEIAAAEAGVDRFVRKFPTSHGLKLLLGDLRCES